jgi:SynChlorMet cassette protein ScmC
MQATSILTAAGEAAVKSPGRVGHAPDTFFAVYSGISMNPTLCEPGVMEVKSYGNRPLRVGDVALFLPPGSDRSIVHRIIRITPAGIATRGDNSNREDAVLLNHGDIQGRVVAVWRGRQQRRKVAGGWLGRLTSGWFRCRRALARGCSPLVSPIYQRLSHWQLFAWMLPVALRPRVVVFGTGEKDHFQLYMGRRIVGRYDGERRQWQIRRPFRLVVDVATLPVEPGRNDGSDHPIFSELQRTIHTIRTQGVGYDLLLADGSYWHIAAQNEAAAAIVAQLGGVMGLSLSSGDGASPPHGNRRRLAVKVEEPVSVEDCYVPLAESEKGAFSSVLCPCSHWGGPYVNLVRLSLVFADKVQAGGGVLIHGALAERAGIGVILAAPGGTGKTTASNRLPAPWRSLCDDATLVVRDAQGCYWAHPWPTWSRFINDGPGGVWDVQRAVPLKGIFFLAQAKADRAERIGSGHAVSMLVEAVKQASMFMAQCFSAEEIRKVHLQRFHNICALSGVVPAHILHLGLTGAFWTEIEQALRIDRIEEPRITGNAPKIDAD